ADVSDPRTWCPFDAAAAAYARGGDAGGGVVFAAAHPVAGPHPHPSPGPRAGASDGRGGGLPGGAHTDATEAPTRARVKGVGRGRLDEVPPFRRGKIEVYDRRRFFALTGARLAQYPASVRPCREALRQIHESLRAAVKRYPLVGPPAEGAGGWYWGPDD